MTAPNGPAGLNPDAKYGIYPDSEMGQTVAALP